MSRESRIRTPFSELRGSDSEPAANWGGLLPFWPHCLGVPSTLRRMAGIPDYQSQRRWTASGTVEHLQAALIVGASRSWRFRVVLNEVGRLEMRMGSNLWFHLGAGLFTPNTFVPMTLVVDVRKQDDALAEIDVTAISDLRFYLIPRPGDRGRYEDAFERLFSNLITATHSDLEHP